LTYLVIELPFDIVVSIIYAAIFNYVIGFGRLTVSFPYFIFTAFAIIFCGESVGIIFCSIVYEPGFSINLASIVFTIAISMAGFLSINMPVIFQFFNNISFIRYAAEVTAVTALQDAVFECSEADIMSGQCKFDNGQQLLDSFGFNVENFTAC